MHVLFENVNIMEMKKGKEKKMKEVFQQVSDLKISQLFRQNNNLVCFVIYKKVATFAVDFL
jgi:hypothetical protein